ncbi:Ribosome association toxin PasT (RatA) of the RatAB toxin-antitoxin module [Paenibacillaceae bacterium GAS479]|nr:Ribosome association toxin PasT (RatA) of the RatAB toxin-antitoxin module [Paenibacillaceae bacterium GAS479]
MYTHNEAYISSPPEEVFRYASEVERWPEHLDHYRQVSFRTGAPSEGIVEMRAWRPFGALRWPVWWVSEMSTEPDKHSIFYRHIEGVTTGMDVEWKVEPHGDGSRAVIVHEWKRPAVGRLAASGIIGPTFVHAIAERTLRGLKAAAEQNSRRYVR